MGHEFGLDSLLSFSFHSSFIFRILSLGKLSIIFVAFSFCLLFVLTKCEGLQTPGERRQLSDDWGLRWCQTGALSLGKFVANSFINLFNTLRQKCTSQTLPRLMQI